MLKPFKRVTVIKPEQACKPFTTWLRVETTVGADLIDDLRRYGFRVFWHNLKWQIRNG